MNKDVIEHAIKKIKIEQHYCKLDTLIHDGNKEDALFTYDHILKMLRSLE